MKLPNQTQAVVRSPHRFKSVSLAGGVRPSGIFDVLKKVGMGALSGALGSIG